MTAVVKIRPSVSIIIPTHNRKEALSRTLAGLSGQTYPASQFEVVVVDDGSSDAVIANAARKAQHFELRCLHQANRGATVARNHGAQRSRGEYLVFMDDDIVPAPDTLAILANELAARRRSIILGTLILPSEITEASPFAKRVDQIFPSENLDGCVPFTECMTGLLAVRRADFFRLGKFRDPTGGWPNWDDLEFGYRASMAGFHFWRSALAVAQHWDFAVGNLDTACLRWYRASKSAARLLVAIPSLRASISTYCDKEPLNWCKDSSAIVFRKLVRRAVWSRTVMWGMSRTVPHLERRAPESKLLVLFYRWIVSGYIYQGYRRGLHLVNRQDKRD